MHCCLTWCVVCRRSVIRSSVTLTAQTAAITRHCTRTARRWSLIYCVTCCSTTACVIRRVSVVSVCMTAGTVRRNLQVQVRRLLQAALRQRHLWRGLQCRRVSLGWSGLHLRAQLCTRTNRYRSCCLTGQVHRTPDDVPLSHRLPAARCGGCGTWLVRSGDDRSVGNTRRQFASWQTVRCRPVLRWSITPETCSYRRVQTDDVLFSLRHSTSVGKDIMYLGRGCTTQ